ncbi:MAG: acetolactate synthase small subunit [Eubacteriales bacterium]
MEKIQLHLSVANRFGVLVRISEMFARRGFNISSLEVHETDDPKVSSMTITVYGDDYIHNQLLRQLGKIHDVISIN